MREIESERERDIYIEKERVKIREEDKKRVEKRGHGLETFKNKKVKIDKNQIFNKSPSNTIIKTIVWG